MSRYDQPWPSMFIMTEYNRYCNKLEIARI